MKAYAIDIAPVESHSAGWSRRERYRLKKEAAHV